MVPGGREPLARPSQDSFLACLARLAERHEERLLQAASQNTDRPLAESGQPPPPPDLQPSAAYRQRSASPRCRSRPPVGWPPGRRTGSSSPVLFPRLPRIPPHPPTP